MREYKCVDIWIDLEKLPKNKKGQISWQESYGICVPFKYGDSVGELEILEYAGKHKYNIVIHVGKHIKKYCMSSSLILACDLGGVLKKTVGEVSPNLIKYFANPEDAFKYPEYYTKPVDMICPICGYKKQQTIELLTLGGFSCPRCSDGKSWAEKFMFNILTQLKVNFKNEVSKKDVGFEWCKNYRYDFYIELKNYKLLIEMDGHFHKDSKFNTYNESRIIDLDKDNLALDNGFDIVRIDCCYPDVLQRFEYIKRNILNSNLSKILDLTSIDWDVANNHALNSNVKKNQQIYLILA